MFYLVQKFIIFTCTIMQIIQMYIVSLLPCGWCSGRVWPVFRWVPGGKLHLWLYQHSYRLHPALRRCLYAAAPPDPQWSGYWSSRSTYRTSRWGQMSRHEQQLRSSQEDFMKGSRGQKHTYTTYILKQIEWVKVRTVKKLQWPLTIYSKTSFQ